MAGCHEDDFAAPSLAAFAFESAGFAAFVPAAFSPGCASGRIGTLCVDSIARSLFSRRFKRTDVFSMTSFAHCQTLWPRLSTTTLPGVSLPGSAADGSPRSTFLSGTRLIFCQKGYGPDAMRLADAYSTLYEPDHKARRLGVKRVKRRLVQLPAACSDDVAAAQRQVALPVRHHAARALENRDQRHDVVRFQLAFDDEVEITGRDHSVVVAVAAEARQQTFRAEPAECRSAIADEHVGMRAAEHRLRERLAAAALQAITSVGFDEPATARSAEEDFLEHGLHE